MDALSHLLVGYTAARAGAGGWAPRGTAVLLAASLLPDAEILHLASGADSYVRHMATWGHSVAGGTGLALAAGAVLWWVHRKRTEPRGLWWRYSLLALLGVALHVLVDWAGTGGVALFYPFRPGRFHLDWFPMTDLLLLVVLLVLLVVPHLFRLIQEEIGAPRKTSGLRNGARLALVALLLMVGFRALQHDNALRRLRSQQFRSGPSVMEAVYPSPGSPWDWHGVADTGSMVELAAINLFRGELEPAGSSFKPEMQPALEAAQQSETAQLFLLRAGFPRARIIRYREGWKVTLEDLRYESVLASGPALSAEIVVDADARIRTETLRWGRFESKKER